MLTQAALTHFATYDPVIHRELQRVDLTELTEVVPSSAYFERLCRSIVGQQLSTKVAEVIYARFQNLVGTSSITPEAVLALSDDALRAVGLSWSKVAYLKDLAARAAAGSIPFNQLSTLDDESIITELTKVKGIGRWTVEMFLMFTLQRQDIFSKGDLGLRRGMQKLYDLEESEWWQKVDEITEVWRPYRTYACLAVWSSLDNKPQ